MKKQLLPDNVFELLFGVGAGVVIIGALLKIINGSLIFSANTCHRIYLGKAYVGNMVGMGCKNYLYVNISSILFDVFNCLENL